MGRSTIAIAGPDSVSNPTRLAFFSTVHPHPWAPHKGAFNHSMLTSLAAADINVRAVIPVPWPERRGAATVIAPGYPVDFPLFRYLPRVAPMAMARQLAWSTSKARRALAGEIDLVFGYWADPDGTVAGEWARSAGVPFVQMVGGSDVMLLTRNAARRGRILATLRGADRVFAIGSHLGHELVRLGIDPDRVEVFRRGVDRSLFHPGDRRLAREQHQLPTDRPVLLWVGRMVPVKGLDVLFDALQQPSLQRLAPVLVLVGDGPLEAHLRRRARAIDKAQVVFAGRQPHAVLGSWYRAADLFVLPSLSEGIPNVLSEAMACGTGFASSDVGGVRELSSDPVKELVPPNDAVALAERISRRLEAAGTLVQEVPDVRTTGRELAAKLRQLV